MVSPSERLPNGVILDQSCAFFHRIFYGGGTEEVKEVLIQDVELMRELEDTKERAHYQG